MVRLFEEIRPIGYTGQVDVVRRFSRTFLTGDDCAGKLTVHFEAASGKQAQANWQHADVFIGLRRRSVKVYAFVMGLSFSRALASAALDRLLQSATVLSLKGDSYRSFKLSFSVFHSALFRYKQKYDLIFVSFSKQANNLGAANPHETLPEDRIPMGKRIAYGFGNFSDHIGTDSLVSNANPIFTVALHVDPRLIGIALGVMRFWDAITDPIVGTVSDNIRTRWGRRIPLMTLGTLGAGLCFPLVWMAPAGSSQQFLVTWFTLLSILFFICQAFFTVPWTALGYELTPDYNERTRLMEQRAYMGTAVGLVVPWTYAFTQLPIWGGNTLAGARWMSIMVGIIIIITGLIPVLTLKERFYAKAKNQPKIGILKSIGMTFQNKPFLMMVVITLFTVVGSRTVSHLGFFVGLYYLFDGDTVRQGVFTGVWGNLALVVGLLSIFVLNRVSHHIGKRRTLAVCLSLLVLASVAQYFLYTPKYPYLSLLVILFVQPATSGFWLLIASIKADICDDDELRTGLRREGAIGSVSAWISKMSTSATAVLAGIVLAATGYQSETGVNQLPGVVDNIRWCFYFIPSATAIPALILLYFFPISEKRSREIRRILEERRGKI